MARHRFTAVILTMAFLLFVCLRPSGRALQQAPVVAPAAGQTPEVKEPVKPPPPNKHLEGTEKAEVLEGGAGHDTLDGRGGDDWLFGEAGNDRLLGGEGNDTLDGGPGTDMLIGGPGDDLLNDARPDDDEFDENDVLLGGEGNDTIRKEGRAGVVDGGPGDDNLKGRGMLLGGDGNDSLRALGGPAILEGGPGRDFLFGADGNDVLAGGRILAATRDLDNDEPALSLPDADVIEGADGDDLLIGGADADVLDGGDDHDTLDGQQGDDVLIGGEGNDTLKGGDGFDRLYGGDNDDILDGSAGDDLLVGGLGLDRIIGGAGNDVIVLRSGDVGKDDQELVDGSAGSDTLVLNGFYGLEIPDLSAGAASRRSFVLTDPITGGVYHVLNVEEVIFSHLFTPISAGTQRSTSFLFVNPSAQTASSARIAFYAENGSPLALSVGGAPAAPTFNFSVPPMGMFEFDVTAAGDVVRGSAQVLANRPIGGSIRGQVAGLGVASLGEGKLTDKFAIPVIEDRAAGLTTGVAIFNGDLDGVKLSLYSTPNVDGPQQVIEVPAGGHRIVLVRDLFPDVGDFRGLLAVEPGHARSHEGSQFAAVGIHSAPGQLSTFSGALISGPQTVTFPGFTSGGNTPSTLFVDYDLVGTLEFFDDGGKPWEVSINGRPPATSVPVTAGTGIFTSPSAGTRQTGSVRLTTTNIETEYGGLGLLRSTRATGGSATIEPGPGLKGFMAPVFRAVQGNRTTEIGLASTGSAVTLSLELRDPAGSLVQGGSAQLSLPANGQVVRTIDALFPGSNTSSFRGTLTVRAQGGTIGASVLDIPGNAGAIAAQPVVPLQ